MCLAQKRVEQLVLEGKNVFFTGNAGTGKGLHVAMTPHRGSARQAVTLNCSERSTGNEPSICVRRQDVSSESHHRRAATAARRQLQKLRGSDGGRRHRSDAHRR